MKHHGVYLSMDTKKLVPKKESIWLSDIVRLVIKMPENSRGHFVRAAKVGLNLCIFATLLMLITASSTISAINSCNKGRFVMNSTFGFITNGPENYQEDSYCVWLITAQSPGQYITLTFHSLQTECAYDHVFVYDGSSVHSPLKGSFSGRGLPSSVTAKSGSMVVLLYSDTNYALEGFSAEYSITDCPLNCSSHGHCVNHTCLCEVAFIGESCEWEACPDQCGFTESRGWCEKIDGVYQCVCNEGFFGMDCSLNAKTTVGNSWHLLGHGTEGTERTAHGGVFLSSLNRFYVFGGFDLNSPLGDLLYFDLTNSKWTNLSSISLHTHSGGNVSHLVNNTDFSNLKATESVLLENSNKIAPRPRYGHAMSTFNDGFVLYGGQLSNRSLSSELFYYDAIRNEWSLLANQSRFRPPSLTRHTLSVVNESWIYIFGGSLPNGQFSSSMYRIHINFSDIGNEEWMEVKPRGGKLHDIRLVGHSTVYHNESHSLIVYGGIMADAARFSKLSDRLFVFDLEQLHWTELLYPRGMLPDLHIPLERAFHGTVLMGPYMVVFGGYTHKHNREEICYDSGLYFYHLGCHTWVSHHVLDQGGSGGFASSFSSKLRGAFSFASAVKDDNIFLIFGGYRGSVTGDILAYVMPPEMVGRAGMQSSACLRHHSQLSCTANPECGWCPADGICYQRTSGANCTSNLQTTQCPGICQALPDCYSCTIHGNTATSSSVDLKLGRCAWCVQTARCHRGDDNLGVCGAGMETPSGIIGWWGSEGTDITAVDECRTRDFRPGLTYLLYEHPANFSQPDDLCIVNSTLANFQPLPKYPQQKDYSAGATMVARMLGFIHPLAPKAYLLNDYQQEFKVMMDASLASATLRISSDDTWHNMEMVANLNANDTNTSRVEAVRADKRPIFPDPSRGNRYLMDFMANRSLFVSDHMDTQREISRMQLVWNGKSNYRKMFTFEYVEPYSNGSCETYTNCMQCLSDSLCGWCGPSRRCLARIAPNGSVEEPSQCYLESDTTAFLILNPHQCINCSNHISCNDCIHDGLCEWIVDEAYCARRGRFANSIQSINECPVPCHERHSCGSCLGEPGGCTWCEETQHCFVFSSYTSLYQFGMCREWVDVEPSHVDGDGSSRLASIRGDLGISTTNGADFMGGIVTGKSLSITNGTRNVGRCKACERKQSCSSCLVDLGCGWCYYSSNPLIGLCKPGDFNSPDIGNCSVLIGQVPSPNEQALSWNWAYAQCPDVDECTLGQHDCHSDAACLNTPGSYICACKKGYIGDGKTFCERTCFEECIHGHCSGSPDYQCECELGWTGSDCNEDCLCHGHSTCYQGIGKCDHCQDLTDGTQCELCRPGSYGNATTTEGCQICQCNNHGNATAGICDPVLGRCYCQDEAEGTKCDRCKPGYYGDPRQGGTCYSQCSSRGILASVSNGSLGSYFAPDMHSSNHRKNENDVQDCVWLLDVDNNIAGGGGGEKVLSEESGSGQSRAIIQLTIHKGAQIYCPMNYVYIYDGLPDFMLLEEKGWTRPNHLLGSYCSPQTTFPINVHAHSGIMTIFYRRSGDPNQGFNATFTVLSCPTKCPSNRVCVDGKCTCPAGWVGIDCDVNICPNDCFSQLNHGKCDAIAGRCLCATMYAGIDCSQSKRRSALVSTELIDPEKLANGLEHLKTVLPRLGHSLVVDHRGSLWLFGGYSMSRGPLNDIREFETKNLTWLQVNVHIHPGGAAASSLPAERYFHAAEYVNSQRGIYVYGGMGQRGQFLSDFWKFDINLRRWMEIETRDIVPPLAGHTLTLRHDGEHETLLLVGGFSPTYGFLEKVMEFSPDNGTWTVLNTTGTPPIGIYGHSAVFHVSTRSLYVYGGMLYKVDKVAPSNELYAFHLPSRRWSLLTIDRDNRADSSLPRARFLHSAVNTDDYMLIIGGQTEPFNSSDTLMAYSYACNLWINLSDENVELIGNSISPAVALAAARQATSRSIYLMGGMWAGSVRGSLLKLQVPDDLCALWSNSKLKCKATPGCSYCAVYEPSGLNATFCYSTSKIPPERCTQPQGVLEFSKGVACGPQRIASRDCYQHTSCSECLGEWPIYRGFPQSCQWCTNCKAGRCIPYGADCQEENRCEVKQRDTIDAAQCHERSCPASDCEKCRELGRCMWTRQVLRTSELSRKLHTLPIYEWNCVGRNIKDSSSFLVVSMPPQQCPARCHVHRGCHECLESTGGEGGWHECRWSTGLNECIAPSYQSIQCVGGMCGAILQGSSTSACPRPCSQFSQCSTCHQQPHCGWCSLNSASLSGMGLCTSGTLDRPSDGSCSSLDYSHITPTSTLVAKNTTWHYQSCPPENECLNGHHTCDSQSEKCLDQLDAFDCVCSEGYVADGHSCRPVCSQGCLHGDCLKPNVCRCHFGFVGANCSIQCQCNGHSECAGPDQLDVCLHCQNNTIGAQCTRCKPLFVGDPRNNGQCISCFEYCNGHTPICHSHNFSTSHLSRELLQASWSRAVEETWIQLIHQGPKTQAICHACSNLTMGEKCEECVPGNFRGSEDRRKICRPCECHGHGDMCHQVTGEGCNCNNNTESDPQCRTSAMSGTSFPGLSLPGRSLSGSSGMSLPVPVPCWSLQCDKCREYYLGTPTQGHQCYRQMSVDTEYCLDPETQEECNRKPTPLHSRRPVFFAIQPKFMNVDIRLLVDVAQGGVDLFFAPRDDMFIVRYDQMHGGHRVELDPKYIISLAFDQGGKPLVQHPNTSIPVERLVNTSDRYALSYRIIEKSAVGLTTFLTVNDPYSVVIIRGLQNRLVLTLPQDRHDLRSTRFYILVQGAGSRLSDVTFGSLFFRQDQPRIDLFVFFSVFFSCFFLFLAVSVVAWKAKQAIEGRRARERQAVEMMHMARRPFASVSVYLDSLHRSAHAQTSKRPIHTTLTSQLCSPLRWKRRHAREHSRSLAYISQEQDGPVTISSAQRLPDIRPLAVEPTADGVAAIATIIVQLPGGRTARTQLTLASALVLPPRNRTHPHLTTEF